MSDDYSYEPYEDEYDDLDDSQVIKELQASLDRANDTISELRAQLDNPEDEACKRCDRVGAVHADGFCSSDCRLGYRVNPLFKKEVA